jgi:hypothetical protein
VIGLRCAVIGLRYTVACAAEWSACAVGLRVRSACGLAVDLFPLIQ